MVVGTVDRTCKPRATITPFELEKLIPSRLNVRNVGFAEIRSSGSHHSLTTTCPLLDGSRTINYAVTTFFSDGVV